MSREQLIVTAGLIFAGISTLTLWTLSATQSPRNRYHSLVEPPFPNTNPEDPSAEFGEKEVIIARVFVPGVIRSRPPGPTPDWLIGNVRHLPKGRWYNAFTAWQKLYGDIFYMTALGRGILIVNSLAIAEELTVKRASTYSGRPHFTMVGDLMGWNWLLTGLNPSPKHTQSRSLLHNSLSPHEVTKYDPIISSQLLELSRSLREFSGHPLEAVNHAVASIIIRIAYGDGVYADVGKELIELNEVTARHLEWVAGRFWPVEYLSFLQYIPDWMPGAEFRRVAKDGYALQRKIRRWPCAEALRRWEEGTLGACLYAEYFDTHQDPEKHSLLRDVLAVMYAAGVDTTTYTILIFLFAIISHPPVQSKIHQELDELLRETPDRPPSPSDRARLPYTEAAWKEAMRWMPTLPLCVPRATLQEDVYNGWHIPRDTLVFINAGFICRDPRLWDEPEVYKPERWLASHNTNVESLPSVYDIVFGFGGRVCPGMKLADRIGFTLAAGLLSLYDIIPPDGKPTPSPDDFVYEDNFARYPSELECYFRPRHHGTSQNKPSVSQQTP